MRKAWSRWLKWAILFSASLALAAGSLQLELKSFKVIKVEDKEGKIVERLIPAAEVKPGDILEWVLTAENVGKDPLKQVALTIPIPPNTIYVKGTARPLELEGGVKVLPLFSYDGVHFSRPPLKKIIKVREGDHEVTKEVIVPPEEYTHVRWVVPQLNPGQKVKVSLRTKVR